MSGGAVVSFFFACVLCLIREWCRERRRSSARFGGWGRRGRQDEYEPTGFWRTPPAPQPPRGAQKIGGLTLETRV